MGELLSLRDHAVVEVVFVARSHLPSLNYDRQLELVEVFAEEVVPRL